MRSARNCRGAASRQTTPPATVSNTFLKTVSAFANYGGGRILFGVADDGTEVGLDDPVATRLSIENKINDSLSPIPDYTLAANPRTGVVTLTVLEGLHKPYLYHSKAYRRADTATVEVDQVELTRLVLEGKNLTFEDMPSERADLSFTYLGTWLRNALGIAEVTPDVLRSLELMGADGAYNKAGGLCADVNDMPGVDMVRFGDSISIFLDRETYEHRSVLEQYDLAVAFFRRYFVYEEVVGFERVTRERIPETAFREAVANALVHRQWDVGSHVRVALFDDRVEVSSPGGLPRGLSEREYLNGQVSALRNPIIGNLFFRLHLIERFGTGVLRIRDAYRGSATQPQFDVYDNSLCVTLPIVQERSSLAPDERLVWDFLSGASRSMSEITAGTGFGKTKAQALLKRMAEAGSVEVTGTGRGTRYHAAAGR